MRRGADQNCRRWKKCVHHVRWLSGAQWGSGDKEKWEKGGRWHYSSRGKWAGIRIQTRGKESAKSKSGALWIAGIRRDTLSSKQSWQLFWRLEHTGKLRGCIRPGDNGRILEKLELVVAKFSVTPEKFSEFLSMFKPSKTWLISLNNQTKSNRAFALSVLGP